MLLGRCWAIGFSMLDMRVLLEEDEARRRRASTPRRGAGLGWGLVAAAKKERLPHVDITLRDQLGRRHRSARIVRTLGSRVRGQAPGADGTAPDGSITGGGGGLSVPIGSPATSGPGNATVAGPATWLTSLSKPKSTRAPVSRPSSP